MKFRTEVQIKTSDKKIDAGDKIFSIGSCFSTEMSELLAKGQLQTLNNPFGTIFNPFSIKIAVKRLHGCHYYTEEDLVAFDGKYISLDHHTAFSENFAHKTLEKINKSIDDGNQFLQEASWVIITYGTAFIYEFLPKNKLVANCHKIPGKFFEKRLLSHSELADSVYETIQNLKDICREDVQILFTVSPVRHTRDGFAENLRSKARLISAVHDVIEEFDTCHYLPVYEIMMDDLRDYRFYKEDMVHPSPQAVNYIFEKFGSAYFSDETMDFVEENFRILQALNHRTENESDPKYKEFISKTNQRIALQQQKVKHRIFVKD